MQPPPGFVDVATGDRRDRVWLQERLGAAAGSDGAAGLVARLWADGVPLGEATGAAAGAGRGAVGLLEFRIDGRPVQLVARDLRRGGLFGRGLDWRFRARRRVFEELTVTARLGAAGVPCVEPAAALARRSGWWWRLRLLTRRVPAALPWPAFVAARPELRHASARAVGGTLMRAFAAGLEHPDLHPENLLLTVDDGGGVDCWLVDLDRARLVAGPVGTAARDAMLLRMMRFLHKHAARLPVRASHADQLRLLAALGLDVAARREVWRRLAPRLAQALERRRGRYARGSDC